MSRASMGMTAVTRLMASIALWLAMTGCSKSPTSPTPPTTPPPPSASLAITFGENPVPFRTSGCSASTPPGWYTSARVQEMAGVAFTPNTFTQKLDGSTTSVLTESFNSRFGACPGSTFTEGVIAANGAVCGVVGVCAASTFATYQFEVTGTDANGHALTFVSQLLQLAARPAGQVTPFSVPGPPRTITGSR